MLKQGLHTVTTVSEILKRAATLSRRSPVRHSQITTIRGNIQQTKVIKGTKQSHILTRQAMYI